MRQMTLFGGENQVLRRKIVNVSSVSQLSPFRYPGGKTWLVPIIREWFCSFDHKPSVFIEPFAGGGIISLTVAFENLADQVIMVEIDDEIAAVWKTILHGNIDYLIRKIMTFKMEIPNLKKK